MQCVLQWKANANLPSDDSICSLLAGLGSSGEPLWELHRNICAIRLTNSLMEHEPNSLQNTYILQGSLVLILAISCVYLVVGLEAIKQPNLYSLCLWTNWLSSNACNSGDVQDALRCWFYLNADMAFAYAYALFPKLDENFPLQAPLMFSPIMKTPTFISDTYPLAIVGCDVSESESGCLALPFRYCTPSLSDFRFSWTRGVGSQNAQKWMRRS